MSRYTHFTKLKHIFLNGGSRWQRCMTELRILDSLFGGKLRQRSIDFGAKFARVDFFQIKFLFSPRCKARAYVLVSYSSTVIHHRLHHGHVCLWIIWNLTYELYISYSSTVIHHRSIFFNSLVCGLLADYSVYSFLRLLGRLGNKLLVASAHNNPSKRCIGGFWSVGMLFIPKRYLIFIWECLRPRSQLLLRLLFFFTSTRLELTIDLGRVDIHAKESRTWRLHVALEVVFERHFYLLWFLHESFGSYRIPNVLNMGPHIELYLWCMNVGKRYKPAPHAPSSVWRCATIRERASQDVLILSSRVTPIHSFSPRPNTPTHSQFPSSSDAGAAASSTSHNSSHRRHVHLPAILCPYPAASPRACSPA
jgi:hypothetical protein